MNIKEYTNERLILQFSLDCAPTSREITSGLIAEMLRRMTPTTPPEKTPLEKAEEEDRDPYNIHGSGICRGCGYPEYHKGHHACDYIVGFRRGFEAGKKVGK